MLRNIMGNTQHGLNTHQLSSTVIRTSHEIVHLIFTQHLEKSYYYNFHITDGRCESLGSKISCLIFLTVEWFKNI